jgi:8-oxo-dGTP pyrophosphatase MutT (NUDIX family)
MPVLPKALCAAHIRRELSGTRLPDDPLAIDSADIRRRLPANIAREMTENLRPAGVLIPLIDRHGGLSVLLTERSADLKHHAGQVSFPGGGMEEQDADIAATALREAHEEVGIHPTQVDIAGFLAPAPTITGYAVTPVVGFVESGFKVRVDPAEVQAAFEVPLDFLMDHRNEEHSARDFGGVIVPVVTFHFSGYRIWGATASILVQLRQLLIR